MTESDILTIAAAFLFGACIGSFINVCIYRLPREISISVPRSYCTNCGAFIPWYYNIPLLSWWFLRGRAPCCGARFSIRYWIIEIITAVLFAVCVWYFGLTVGAIYAVFFSFMLVAFFTDVDFMIIPDRVNFGAAVFAFACSAFFPVLHDVEGFFAGVRESVTGALASSGVLWTISKLGTWILKKDSMGMGDVKLMLAIGGMMGWGGALYTIGMGSIIGSVFGLVFVFFQGKHLGSGVAIPFGPALISAAFLWIFFGKSWWGNNFTDFFLS